MTPPLWHIDAVIGWGVHCLRHGGRQWGTATESRRGPCWPCRTMQYLRNSSVIRVGEVRRVAMRGALTRVRD